MAQRRLERDRNGRRADVADFHRFKGAFYDRETELSDPKSALCRDDL
jgi:hypothetical protein